MTLTSKDLIFNAKSHRYKIAETKPAQYIPSVTTIGGLLNKPFLVEWSARVTAEAAIAAMIEHQGPLNDEDVDRLVTASRAAHRGVRDEGARVGSDVHDRIKMFLRPDLGEPEDYEDAGIEADMAFSCFVEWHEENIVNGEWDVVEVERIVVHPNGHYCGTFDLLLRHKSQPTRFRLVDWKTSNQSDSNPAALYPEYYFQISAYVRAIEASPEYDVDFIEDGMQVSLGKNGRMIQSIIDRDDIETCGQAFESLASILPVYRGIEKKIRAANKAVKAELAAVGEDNA